MTALFDVVENLPERFQQDRGSKITPWGDGDVIVKLPGTSGKIVHKPAMSHV